MKTESTTRFRAREPSFEGAAEIEAQKADTKAITAAGQTRELVAESFRESFFFFSTYRHGRRYKCYSPRDFGSSIRPVVLFVTWKQRATFFEGGKKGNEQSLLYECMNIERERKFVT